ncbi:hypothetical protein MPH_06236 [Macrophomina phaseolina MS6]|uniref:Uncharacterized protein n=1 Tax=Macrophomina phaseolina (strain MS6) TaxID=1126212 RepID=K2SHZ3_MACPH|nr:hypothetical protein MPH_06236 [Macrophomina phaseolina MS6]
MSAKRVRLKSRRSGPFSCTKSAPRSALARSVVKSIRAEARVWSSRTWLRRARTGSASTTSVRRKVSACGLMSKQETVRPWAAKRAAQEAPMAPQPMMVTFLISGVEVMVRVEGELSEEWKSWIWRAKTELKEHIRPFGSFSYTLHSMMKEQRRGFTSPPGPSWYGGRPRVDRYLLAIYRSTLARAPRRKLGEVRSSRGFSVGSPYDGQLHSDDVRSLLEFHQGENPSRTAEADCIKMVCPVCLNGTLLSIHPHYFLQSIPSLLNQDV